MKERVKEGEKQLEELKKMSLESEHQEVEGGDHGDEKPAAAGSETIKKKKNQKPKTSSKKKGKGKK
jgi:hypothetical protein